MKAGRELDALVAERVMGWGRMTWAKWAEIAHHTGRNKDHTLTGYWHDQEGKQVARAEFCDDYYQPEAAWSPSTDIAAAMEVVDKMQGEPDGPQAWWWLIQDTIEGRGWHVRIDDGERAIHAAVNKSLPLAICLAALKAKGVVLAEPASDA